jgi:hypothetical protein
MAKILPGIYFIPYQLLLYLPLIWLGFNNIPSISSVKLLRISWAIYAALNIHPHLGQYSIVTTGFITILFNEANKITAILRDA